MTPSQRETLSPASPQFARGNSSQVVASFVHLSCLVWPPDWASNGSSGPGGICGQACSGAAAHLMVGAPSGLFLDGACVSADRAEHSRARVPPFPCRFPSGSVWPQDGSQEHPHRAAHYSRPADNSCLWGHKAGQQVALLWGSWEAALWAVFF